MTILYSRGTSIHDTQPAQRTAADFAAFVDALEADRAPKKDSAAYFCGPLNGDGKRGAEGALPRRWLALDFDKIAPEALPELRMWLAQFSGCGWPTHSSKPDAPRERAIIELDREATRDECMTLGAALARDVAEKFGAAVKLDECTIRPEQPVFVAPKGAPLARFEGEPLNVQRTLDRAPKTRQEAPERPTSDASGEDDLLGRIERGDDLHGNLRTLIARWLAKGMDAKAVRAAAVGLLERARKARPDRVDAMQGAELDRLIEQGVKKYAPETGELPAVLDLAELARTEPEPPQFLVRDWLPAGEVCLFSGHGGSGKSAIALYLAVCIAAGRPFFGMPTQRRRVFVLSLEDSRAVLHWRVRRICAWLGVDLATLADWLTLADGSAVNGELYSDTREGAGLTYVFDWLAECMQGRQVLVVDGISDAFGGIEINRRQVRAFVRALRRLIPADGAALALGHVDKASAKAPETSQGFSGSTAWHNSVRSRWYLRPDGDDDGLLLELQKSNHAPAGASVRVRWLESAHVFAGEAVTPAGRLERELAESDERACLVQLIAEADKAGEPIPAAASGWRTSWHALKARAGFPAALASGSGKARFWRLLEQLRAAGAVRVESVQKKNRHFVEVLRAAG